MVARLRAEFYVNTLTWAILATRCKIIVKLLMRMRNSKRATQPIRARYLLATMLMTLIAVLSLTRPASAQERKLIQASVGSSGNIDVHLYLPEGKGPFPLIVLSHGSSQDPRIRLLQGPNTMRIQAMDFVARGFVAAVPIRRGYGPTATTSWAEDFEDCSTSAYRRAAMATAEDIRASVKAVLAEPAVDRSRIVLLGFSAGGWGSLAAASLDTIPGLKAVVNFAGGRGSKGPNIICGGDNALINAVPHFAGSKIPQLWIYARNDLFFGADLATRMHSAFTKAGGKAAMILAPAIGTDGHGYLFTSTDWRDAVHGFLRSNGAQ